MILASATTTSSSGGATMIIMIVALVAIMYFMMIRPQNKEKKKMQEMMNSLEPGDAVVTNAGFYGVVIDMTEDDVIVEFGNNKNCRIPMKKEAIIQVEKPQDAIAKKESDAKEKEEKK